MAHLEQRDFIVKIKNKLPHYFTQSKVLEVGSLNINGTIRDFFTDCKYIGIDVSPGVGVDVVCEGQNYNAPDDIYDVVCSAECFEHNPYWLETFQNMIRLCKDDGLILFTCATDGRGEHGTSRTAPLDSPLTIDMGWDYYRNLNENDFVSQLNFDFYFSEYQFEVNDKSHDLYFWGILKKKNIESIPVIGVPIVNGFHWLQRLVDSIDYPVKELCVINNNGRGELDDDLEKLSKTPHKFIEKIKVCNLPANIGCSGAWNLIIKTHMMDPYWLIVNHDIAFSPGLLEELFKKAKNNEYGIIKGGGGQWDIFLLKDWVVEKCGLFDENFYPAYVEDCDYFIRTQKQNVGIYNMNFSYIHGENNYETTGSQTWRTDMSLKEKLDYAHNSNHYYMVEKWGSEWNDVHNCTWNYNPYQYPFNDPSIPITYTSYDLKFVRRKNLGF
jgi:SAM-dependent methyltransferase